MEFANLCFVTQDDLAHDMTDCNVSVLVVNDDHLAGWPARLEPTNNRGIRWKRVDER